MNDRVLRLPVRYYSRFTAPGVAMAEANCRHVTLQWDVPLAEAALVCLDIWDRDIHADMREVDDRVTRERIVPVVEACRERGVAIIHAPTPEIASRHPNCVHLVADDEVEQPRWPDSPVWPPQAFRAKTGDYARFSRPDAAVRGKYFAECAAAEFHELVQPVGDEPVIRTGEELHRLCAARRFLHLIYVGFHTPGCMTGRTYGLIEMLRRGYHVILLRDCTNGMETHETRDQQISQRGTVAFLEQSGVYTMTGPELIASLESMGR